MAGDNKSFAVVELRQLGVVPLADRGQITGNAAVDFAFLALVGLDWGHIVIFMSQGQIVFPGRWPITLKLIIYLIY